MSPIPSPKYHRRPLGNRKKQDREYLQFLKWLSTGPKPWLEPQMRRARERWQFWQTAAKYYGRSSDAVSFITGAPTEDDYALRKAFYYARRMRYVVLKQMGKRLTVGLTDLGRKKLLRNHLGPTTLLPSDQALVVMFDIPEHEHRTRDFFRSFLKENGFKQIQQSVWYTRKDVRKEVYQFIHLLDLEEWIQVCIATFLTVPRLR